MLPKNQVFKTQYNKKMNAIKEANRQKIIHDYRTRLMLYLSDQDGLAAPIDDGFINIEVDNTEKNPITENLPINYFSEERIAVYTVMFGDEGALIEPLTVPDNCDFYVFTDQGVAEDSVWTKVEVDLTEHDLEDQTSVLKNSFFKMNPHSFFEDYRYSLYVDGDIKIMTDPTEFIERLDAYGVLFHDDYRMDCAYLETERCHTTGLITDEEYEHQLAHLQEQGLPRNYGFLDSAVIFRAHYNEVCMEMMNEWWQEFLKNAKQAQLNLPLVLYRREIRTLELAGLGKDLYSNYAFQKVNRRPMVEETVKFEGEVAT